MKDIVQLVSQVSPWSGEKACSHSLDVAVTFDQVNCTMIG